MADIRALTSSGNLFYLLCQAYTISRNFQRRHILWVSYAEMQGLEIPSNVEILAAA